MKKYYLLMIILLSGLASFCQDQELPSQKMIIRLKSGKKITGVWLWHIHDHILEYKKDASLHDAIIEEIAELESDSSRYRIETGKLKKIPDDLIIKTTGDSISCTIYEIREDLKQIVYLDRKINLIKTISFALVCKYSIGGIEGTEVNLPVISKPDSSEKYNYYEKGKQDAKKYYHGYKEAGTVALIASSLMTPFWGLLPTAVISSVPPQQINLNYPDTALMKNPDYNKGYKRKAREIKRTKIWKNYGMSFFVDIGALILFASLMQTK